MIKFIAIIALISIFSTQGLTAPCAKIFLSNSQESPLSGPAVSKFNNIPDMVAPMIKEMQSKLKFKRINTEKDLTWKGPSNDTRLGMSEPFENYLTANDLEATTNREVLGQILQVYTLLNISQGRRYVLSTQQMGDVVSIVKSLRTPVESGNLAEIVTSTEIIQTKLNELKEGKGFLPEGSVKTSILADGKSDWATPHNPLDRAIINEAVADLILQAFRVTGAANPKAELINILESHTQLGMSEGRADLYTPHSRYTHFTFAIESLRTQAQLADTVGQRQLLFLSTVYENVIYCLENLMDN